LKGLATEGISRLHVNLTLDDDDDDEEEEEQEEEDEEEDGGNVKFAWVFFILYSERIF
jgi:hypothetical protein